jgi:hypothetical protein
MFVAGLAALAFTPALWALDEPPEKAPAAAKTPKERYQALIQEQQKAMNDFMAVYQKATTDEERSKLFQSSYPQPQTYVARFMEIADSAPDDPTAVDALVWVVRNGRSGPDVTRAIDRLVAGHAGSPKVGSLASSLVYSQTPAAEKLLRLILEKNTDHNSQGQACLALGRYLNRKAEMARNLKEDPSRAKLYEPVFGPGVLSRSDPDALAREAEKMFERTVKEFGDISLGRNTLGASAKSELNEIRNLGIGKPAPEINGEDIDGTPFKLSDYKGKVVVVDFWGDW